MAFLVAVPALAQEIPPPSSVLPATGLSTTGADVRVGDLRDQLTTAFAGGRGAPPPAANPDDRGYTITPAIGLTQEYTDNASATGFAVGPGRGQGNGRGSAQQGRIRGDFITIVQPSISVTAETTRLQGSLTYAPQIELYAHDGHQNRVAQLFSGRLLATLLPQTLFLDLRGSGSLQSASGLQGPASTTSQLRSNTVQAYTFSAAPYALHRFGPWGTGEVGATFSQTTQSALQDSFFQTNALATDPRLTGSSASQDVTSYGGHAAFATGEEFGRYNGTALAYATYYDGVGVLSGARRNIATVDNGYAITRTITALGKLGWEDIRYSGTNPQRINDLVWDFGVRLLPNDQSTITLRYGHHDGFNSLLVDAAYQPTARTRIYLRYSSGLTTQAEELQNALATSDVDTLGNPIDHATGAPLIGGDSFFGAQNNLSKVKLLTVTGSLLLDRDVVTANLNAQDRRVVSASGLPAVPGFSQFGTFIDASSIGSNKGIYGSLSWSHDLRPDLTGSLFGQYGVLSAEGPPHSTQHLLVGSAALSYALTRTLSGRAQYSYTQNIGDAATGSSTENLVLVSLQKSF